MLYNFIKKILALQCGALPAPICNRFLKQLLLPRKHSSFEAMSVLGAESSMKRQAIYRQAIRRYPRYAEAFNNLGYVYVAQKRYGETAATLS